MVLLFAGNGLTQAEILIEGVCVGTKLVFSDTLHLHKATRLDGHRVRNTNQTRVNQSLTLPVNMVYTALLSQYKYLAKVCGFGDEPGHQT